MRLRLTMRLHGRMDSAIAALEWTITTTAAAARSSAVRSRFRVAGGSGDSLRRRQLRKCKRSRRRAATGCSMAAEISVAVEALLLRRSLRRVVLAAEATPVAVAPVPASVAEVRGAAVLAAVEAVVAIRAGAVVEVAEAVAAVEVTVVAV